MAEHDAQASPVKSAERVAEQCRVVAHLARRIASVHEQKAEAYGQADLSPGFIDFVGDNTARLMEILGDVLNGMDAVDEEEDAWTFPVFEAAQCFWPQPAPRSSETPPPRPASNASERG